MSISQKLAQLQASLQQQGTWGNQDSISLMRNINKFRQPQLSSNQTAIRQKLNTIVPAIMESFGQLQGANSPVLLSSFASVIGDFRQRMKPFLSDSYLNQLKNINSRAAIINQRKNAENKGRQQSDKALRQYIQSKSGGNQQLSSIAFDFKATNNLQPANYFTIQQQIQPIKAILNSASSIMPIQKVPQSVDFLNKYAVGQGYLSMGSVSDMGGKSYIGRSRYKQGQIQKTAIFPMNPITTGSTPNILTNFKFYANKTINAWNNFVQNENKLIDFSNKIATTQLRRKYMEQQLKGLNRATFKAHVLCTLVYYYVYIPIQGFLKFKFDKYDGTMTSFIDNYLPGSMISKNPFLLTANGARLIAKHLFQPVAANNRTFDQYFATAIQLLAANLNKVNQNRYDEVQNYPRKKQSEARAYFQSNGIMQNDFKAILDSPFIHGIQFKTIILPSLASNSQILALMQKVQSARNYKQKDPTQWSLTWGMSKIPCHDYIWEYNV